MNGQETQNEENNPGSKTKKEKGNGPGSTQSIVGTTSSNASNDGAKTSRRRKSKNASDAVQIEKDKTLAKQKISNQIERLEELEALI